MNQESIREYADRQRQRYRYGKADKAEKSKVPDEVVAVIGYHRKVALRLLSSRRPAKRGRRVGRPKRRRDGNPREEARYKLPACCARKSGVSRRLSSLPPKYNTWCTFVQTASFGPRC